jgi:hypothetical protein
MGLDRAIFLHVLVLPVYLGYTTNQKTIPCSYLFFVGSGSPRSSSVIFGYFIAQEVDALGDMGMRYFLLHRHLDQGKLPMVARIYPALSCQDSSVILCFVYIHF